MNCICIVGKLGKNPELKSSSSGKSYAKFSVAVTRPYGKKGENGYPPSDWFDVTVFGTTANYVADYLSKGCLVSVTGSMESNKGSDGKVYWNVIANSVQRLDRPRDDAQPSGNAGQSAPAERDPFEDD